MTTNNEMAKVLTPAAYLRWSMTLRKHQPKQRAYQKAIGEWRRKLLLAWQKKNIKNI